MFLKLQFYVSLSSVVEFPCLTSVVPSLQFQGLNSLLEND